MSTLSPFRRQLELLGYEDEDVVYLRGFFPKHKNKNNDDKGRKKNFKLRQFKLIEQTIERWEGEGRGCYFVVNGQAQTSGGINHALAAFYEHDDISLDHSRHLWKELSLPQPTLQVTTGGKSIHTYWAIADRPPIEKWRELMEDLIFHAQSDQSIKDPSRVLRCAGALHAETQNRAEIVSESSVSYTFAELRGAVPDRKPVIQAVKEGSKTPSDLIDRLVNEALQHIPARDAGNNTYQLYRGLLRGLKAHYGEDSAVALMESHSPSSECGWDVAQVAESSHPADGIGMFFHFAKQLGWEFPAWAKAEMAKSQAPTSAKGPNGAEVAVVIGKDGQPQPEKQCKQRTYHQIIKERWGNLLQWNEFTLEVEYNQKPIEDLDQLLFEFSCEANFSITGKEGESAVKQVAKKQTYNPLKLYLDRVRGVHENTDTNIFRALITDCLTLQIRDDLVTLYAEYFRRMMIGAVGRVFAPGQKFDYCLVLQGIQGSRKSTFWRILCGDRWFSDTVFTIDGKDSLQMLAGVWFLELAEIERFTGKRHVEQFKQFLSSAVDRYRPPYGRNVTRHRRQMVFAGTANKIAFLNDDTGNRRLWLVPGIEAINIDWLVTNRDQLWATAKALYDAGETPYLSPLFERQSAIESLEYHEADPWDTPIQLYLTHNIESFVPTSAILGDCLKIERGKQTRADEMRVAAIMKQNGWKAYRKRVLGSKIRGFIREETGPTSGGWPEVGPKLAHAETYTEKDSQASGPTGPEHSFTHKEKGGEEGPVSPLPTHHDGYSENRDFSESTKSVGEKVGPVGPGVETHTGKDSQMGHASDQPKEVGPASGTVEQLNPGDRCGLRGKSGVFEYCRKLGCEVVLKDSTGKQIRVNPADVEVML